jgi:hypothetical protein
MSLRRDGPDFFFPGPAASWVDLASPSASLASTPWAKAPRKRCGRQLLSAVALGGVRTQGRATAGGLCLKQLG